VGYFELRRRSIPSTRPARHGGNITSSFVQLASPATVARRKHTLASNKVGRCLGREHCLFRPPPTILLLMRWPLILFLFLAATACRSSRPEQPPLSPGVLRPDGAAFLFSVANGETCFLYEANIASGAMHRLTRANTGCESDPTFSADGHQLAFMFARERGARAALILANPDGTSQRTLVSSAEDNFQPVFVPHSNRILFLRSEVFGHSSPLVNNRRHKIDLFSADLASGDVTQITQQKFYECGHVAVSADGRRIILSVNTYPEGSHFLILPADGTGTTMQSLQPAVANAPSPPEVYNASFLPDGRSIIFSAAAQPPTGNFDYNVYRLDIASGAMGKLTAGSGLLDSLSASADGKTAVLLRQGVYSILDLATHHLTTVPIRLHNVLRSF